VTREKGSKKAPGPAPGGNLTHFFLLPNIWFLLARPVFCYQRFLVIKDLLPKIAAAVGLWPSRDDLRVTDLLNLANTAV
jgi:hypothetical protein